MIRKHNCNEWIVHVSFKLNGFLSCAITLIHLFFCSRNFYCKMGKKDKTEQSLFTKEEEQLLSDFSRNVSTKSSALFYGSAFMVSSLPICKYLLPGFVNFIENDLLSPSSFTGLYWRIHMIDMMPALIWFILVTSGSTYLIAFAYKNTKFILKHKVCVHYFLLI